MTLDETIEAMTDILSSEYGRYDGGGWYLATESEIENAIGYLKQYRDKQKLIDTLRKDLMQEREMYAEALKGVKDGDNS